jgi:hypothetical protein
VRRIAGQAAMGHRRMRAKMQPQSATVSCASWQGRVVASPRFDQLLVQVPDEEGLVADLWRTTLAISAPDAPIRVTHDAGVVTATARLAGDGWTGGAMAEITLSRLLRAAAPRV